MSGTNPTRGNALILVVLLFAQLLVMAGSARGSSGSTRLESWVMDLSSPVVRLADLVSHGVAGLVTGSRDLFRARSRNVVLESELQRLRTEVQHSREATLENIRLRRLLRMRDALAPSSIGGTVVSSVHTGREHMLILDRGSRHGVRRDQAIVAWGGVMGRVVEVGRVYCKVQLLTDPNSGIAGLVQRSRAQGMVQGAGSDTLDLLYVPRLSDVANGDRVVSSGLDGIFPRGFGIGRVIAIHERPDGSRTIKLMPELDYRSVEEVLILLEASAGELLPPPGAEETP